MGGEQNGGAEPVQLNKQAHQAPAHLWVDISGGLVSEDEIGLADHRACDRDALFFTAGERCGPRVYALTEADPVDQLANIFSIGFSRRAGHPQGQGDVLEHIQMIKEAEILEDHADAAAKVHRVVAIGERRVLTEQADLTARGLLGQIHQAQKGCLSRARWAGEKMKRARWQRETHIAQNFGPPAITQSNAFKANRWRT